VEAIVTTGDPPAGDGDRGSHEGPNGGDIPKAHASDRHAFLRLGRHPRPPGSDAPALIDESPRSSARRGAPASDARRQPQYLPESQTEIYYGTKPGSRYARLTRTRDRSFQRDGRADTILATAVADTPRTLFEWISRGFKRAVVGAPLASSRLTEQKLTKVKALAIFASDALSSTAYATEEILLILVLAGASALIYSIPISIAIAALLIIVSTSYRQTIRAYPQGGGAYKVALENLGTVPGLVAGASLVVDYTLTVAVSAAAGVAAITSAFPELHDARVIIAVVCVSLLTAGNLRGVREAGTMFAIPTYFFLVTFVGMIVVGFVRLALGNLGPAPHDGSIALGTSSIGVFLLLRAFSSGATALTGIEAISNGVPAFKAPEPKNAATTLTWMALILTTMFISLTVLAHRIDVYPSESKTVVAQIADAVFAGGPLFYVVQAATALILLLAANTSFAGLPALASVMARDRYAPHIFSFRGDRLGYSNGIMVLAAMSIALLVLFNAETHKLIPLYAVGVFVGFTLSQLGMVVHWRRSREQGWRRAMAINGVGGVASGIVAVIIAGTKFTHGAWITILAIGTLAVLFGLVGRYYRGTRRQLAIQEGEVFLGAPGSRFGQVVLLPFDELNRATLRAISYALSISNNVTAIHVSDDLEEGATLRRDWERHLPDVPLVIIQSEFRSLLGPLLSYMDALDRASAGQTITVILPQYVARWPWQRILNNQSGQRLKRALFQRPNVAVTDVPYHLQ
jgi:amino acid transporter